MKQNNNLAILEISKHISLPTEFFILNDTWDINIYYFIVKYKHGLWSGYSINLENKEFVEVNCLSHIKRFGCTKLLGYYLSEIQ